MQTAWPKSACAPAQSDQDRCCPLTESLDTTERMNGEQRPEGCFAHSQNDLNLRFLRMLDGLFSLDAAHIISRFCQRIILPEDRLFTVVAGWVDGVEGEVGPV